jgi:hypothetical protein
MRVQRHSLATLVVALALLGAQTSGFLHILLVEHERCGEHGEMVEAHHRPPPSPAPLITPSDGTSASASGSPSVTHDHDHCLVLLDRRASAPLAGPAQLAITVESRTVSAPVRATGAPRGPPLYRLAPKNSPPA